MAYAPAVNIGDHARAWALCVVGAIMLLPLMALAAWAWLLALGNLFLACLPLGLGLVAIYGLLGRWRRQVIWLLSALAWVVDFRIHVGRLTLRGIDAAIRHALKSSAEQRRLP